MIKYPMIYQLYGLKLDWDDKIPNDLQAYGLKLDWDDKIPIDLQALWSQTGLR